MSPWTDLSLSGASMTGKADDDPLLTRAMLSAAVANYLGDQSPRDPRASPVFADLSGLPPLLIHVGDDEVLLYDSTRVRERVEAGGGNVRVERCAYMIHVFPSLFESLMPARRHSTTSASSCAHDHHRRGRPAVGRDRGEVALHMLNRSAANHRAGWVTPALLIDASVGGATRRRL